MIVSEEPFISDNDTLGEFIFKRLNDKPVKNIQFMEPFILDNDTLGEFIFKRLNDKPVKNIQFMVDLTKQVSLTFQDILQYSVNLSIGIENLGIRHNDVVGIFSENCWESTIIILASWYIGASVAFIDPNFIKSELYHCLKITEPKILFTTENRLEFLENITTIKEIILFGKYSEPSRLGFRSLLLNSEINLQTYKPKRFETKDTVACIMSSSGTTGLPKAVMSTHDNLKFCIKFMADPNTINFNSKTRTLLYLPLFHIMGMMVFLGSINDGEKLLIMSKFRAEEFLTVLENNQVNSLFVVPPTLQFLAKSPLTLKHDLSFVEHIICGGAPVSKDIEIEVTNRLMNAKVRQIYGMTEVGAATAVPLNEARFGSVGKVIKDLTIKIIDPETKKILGPNNSGEICIKGPSIMKGYMKNSEETRNCIDSDGFMHSGDIGYYDTDGFIFVVDRIKEVIKYKAFQVAPAEIEAQLIKHKAVKEVGIVGKPDKKCGELPTAFVVVQPGEHVTEKGIFDYVADNFSREKHLHGGVYFVEKIPRTPSGKILRRELRKMLKDS